MKAPAAVALVVGLTVVVVSAVVVTGVRSEASNSTLHATSSAAPLARAANGGPVVTVPGLSGGTGASSVSADPTAASADGAAQSQDAAAQAERASAASGAAASTASARAAAEKIAAARAAAEKAAAAKAAAEKVAAARAAAEKAAASRAAADRAAAASSAASSSQSAASSAASVSSASVSSASAAASSSSAAASSSAASRSAASASMAAASTSAAADPAADTSEAVESAVDEANLTGVTESVIVMNRQDGSITTSVNADAEVPSMSLVKLMLAADVIDRAGSVDAVDPDTLAQLHQMIAVSDDSIAQDFYDAGGRSAIITRVVDTYGLRETSPAPNPRYWGDVRITARDMASLLYQLLSSPDTGLWFTQAMEAAEDTGADGFDQNFGMNAIPGSGSKQGWGCCLDDVLAIHSVGFTAGQIVVVLSTSDPDAPSSKLGSAKQLTADAQVQAALAAVTRTAAAAVG